MIAPDANLLIYCYDPISPFHSEARLWFERIISSAEPIGIPILSVYAFLRYVTHPKRLMRPLRFADAAEIVDLWLSFPNVRVLYPGERHWTYLQQVCNPLRIGGAQITDAAIAALAVEYGATVHTNDRDFARFPGLRWHNPLIA